MDVSIVGSGYVGTTVGASLAELGHTVVTIDIDEARVDTLNAGEAPIHEPGLQPLLDAHVDERFRATTEYDAIRETDLTILAIGTPTNPDGSIDLSALEAAARSLGEALAAKEGYHLVVVKSTVVPGMTEERLVPILEAASGKTEGEEFGVALNPEFQSQGSAIEDFMNADKIVVGTDGDERALALLRDLYAPLADEDTPLAETGRREAAMTKYANNVFLASKVSLVNELGNICKEYDVDAYEVMDAIGLDERIGAQFLRSGVGWGGSCFPKDTAALIAAARAEDYAPDLLKAAVSVNEKQPQRMLTLLERHVDPARKQIAVLGLAFKRGTDDIRNSRAIPIIEGLLDRGADVVAYDPVASEDMAERFPDVEYATSATDALRDAHGALVVTDWDEFAALDEEFNAMATSIVVDGRRIVKPHEGITYEGLTW